VEAITLSLKKYSMPFKKVEVPLKFPKCLHLEKLLLAYVIHLLMPYNFCNYNIFMSLKITVILKMDEVIAPPCISLIAKPAETDFEQTANNFWLQKVNKLCTQFVLWDIVSKLLSEIWQSLLDMLCQQIGGRNRCSVSATNLLA